MQTSFQAGNEIHKQLEQKERTCNDERTDETMITRYATTQDVLRQIQHVCLEIKPCKREHHKNNSTHHTDGEGAIVSYWIIIVHTFFNTTAERAGI